LKIDLLQVNSRITVSRKLAQNTLLSEENGDPNQMSKTSLPRINHHMHFCDGVPVRTHHWSAWHGSVLVSSTVPIVGIRSSEERNENPTLREQWDHTGELIKG
jgi:hypothetical protein